MPYIQVQAGNGTTSGIHSSNPETLAAWLWEQVSRMHSGTDWEGPLYVTVRPLSINVPGVSEYTFDWTPDTRLNNGMSVRMTGLETPYQRAQAMISALSQLAEQFNPDAEFEEDPE